MSTEPHDDRDQATLIELGDDGVSHNAPSRTSEPSDSGHTSTQDSDTSGQSDASDSFAAHSFGSDSTFASDGDSAGSSGEAPTSSASDDRPTFGPFSRMLNAAARVQAAPAQLANMAETANDVLNAAKNNPSMLADLVRLEVERGVGALGLVTPTDFVALRKRVKDAEREAAKAAKHNQTLKETVDSLALRMAQLEQEIVDLKADITKKQGSDTAASGTQSSTHEASETPTGHKKTPAKGKSSRNTTRNSAAAPEKTANKRNTKAETTPKKSPKGPANEPNATRTSL